MSSCASIIKYNGYNPKNPGEKPLFSNEYILLGENNNYKNCYDVYYYDLYVNIDPEKKWISGSVEIYATAKDSFETIQIDLHPNFEITNLTDQENNAYLNYRREERAVFIDINKKKNQKFIIKVDYSGNPLVAEKPPWKGGFVWKKYKGNPWAGVACESEGASIWWPLKDHQSDEPDSMKMHFKVPEGLMAISNGTLENVDTLDNKCIFNWRVTYPINTYNVTFYLGNFKLLEDKYIGIEGRELHINHYVFDKNFEKAKEQFQQLHTILNIYEDKFGEYPFYNDGFKLVESPYRGMEHQTAIAYGNKFKNNLYKKVDYIMLHETAHEWWGNSVTAKDFADVWLQEGFATYAEVIFLENEFGKDLSIKHLKRLNIFIKNKQPLVGVENRRWFHYKEHTDVYMKGAWVLHTLRKQIDNDSIFFDILKSFAEDNMYSVVSSFDFIKLVNEKTRQDYTWFFNQYLFKRYCPVLNYAITRDGTLYYKWGNVPDEFNKLDINFKSCGQTFSITPTNKVQIFKLPPLTSGKRRYKLIGDRLCYYRPDYTLFMKYRDITY